MINVDLCIYVSRCQIQLCLIFVDFMGPMTCKDQGGQIFQVSDLIVWIDQAAEEFNRFFFTCTSCQLECRLEYLRLTTYFIVENSGKP